MKGIKAQEKVLIMEESYSNLAVFVTDFVTNQLKGGMVYHLPKNHNDSLKFRIDYRPPSDFGGITFTHLPSNRVIFKGGLHWDGLGTIEIPHDITLPKQEIMCNYPVERPKHYQYYEYSTLLQSYIIHPEHMASELVMLTGEEKYHDIFKTIKTQEEFLDRLWSSVAHLNIVHRLVQKHCSVGFYLYTPTAGMADPTTAQWITFLYVR